MGSLDTTPSSPGGGPGERRESRRAADWVVLEPALAAAGVALCAVGPGGHVLSANEPWIRIAGAASEDTARGRDVLALLPGRTDVLRAAFERARAGQPTDIPPQLHVAGGREAWWEGTFAPLPLPDGTGVLVVARDVTARCAAQAASARTHEDLLARVEVYEAERVARARAEALEREATLARGRVEHLQRITAALSSAVMMKDVARVLFEQGLETFGAKAVGIVWTMRPGQFDLVFGHGVSEPEFRMLDRAARAGEALPIRDAIRGRRAVWLETPEEIRARYPVLEPLRRQRGESGFAVVPLVLGDRCPGVIGFTFDRPRRFAPGERAFVEALAQLSAQAFERARLFEAEQEARRDAERVGQIQQQLMSVVGHDLRTPLAAIRMSSAGLLRRPGLPPDQERALRRIVNGAARMSGILRDLLDLARTRQGLTIPIHRDPVDLGEVAREAVVDFEDPDVPARVVVETEGDLCVAGDAGRLSQVISNLVGNALQHGAGAPVRVHARGGEGEVVLEVHNGGPPITPALLPEVFEPFRRGAGHRDRTGSVGLGLFIVREVVRAHGGTVAVRSDAASGTTFAVRLPRQAPPAG